MRFKRKIAENFRFAFSQTLGGWQQVQSVVIGGGGWTETYVIVVRTPGYLLLHDGFHVRMIPLPTDVPKVNIVERHGVTSAELVVERDGPLAAFSATKFPVEPLCQIIEGALPEGVILTHPLRPSLPSPAPVAETGPSVPETADTFPPSGIDGSDLGVAPLDGFEYVDESADEAAAWDEPASALLRPRHDIDWQGPVRDFEDSERFAAAHMRYLGFADAVQTQEGVDSGIDVESIRAVAQVKFHAKPIGSPGLQNLRGVAWQKEYALFYSLSGYTQRALDWADANHVLLFTYTRQGTAHAANAAARRLERQSRALLEQDAASEGP
ncbi:hypothetical protein GS489_31750 [Rhodococcus hoagii]|nr:hypothetical protein [Prescottella equi]MBM4570225.1 hypothetical protein [Prescottella equi]MBM4570238.1 hypothetical protein [Prescottella equi]MBM4574794.1 hypothetical protein [Prescottella equi]